MSFISQRLPPINIANLTAVHLASFIKSNFVFRDKACSCGAFVVLTCFPMLSSGNIALGGVI